MNITVMGAGAVGAYFGGLLARAGHQVTLIARQSHVDAINARGGLQLDSKAFTGIIPLNATSKPSGVANAELVLLAVKSADTEFAGRSIAPHLAANASIVSLQNGVDNAERLSAVLGRDVIPVVVYVATEMAGPGHVRHHGRGELILGPSPASASLAALLSAAKIPTTVSDTVRDTLWEKLILNCAYNALSAIPQLSYGEMFAVEGTTGVVRNVVDECTAVAKALGVTVAPDIHARTLALAKSMPAQKSSTAQDLARGKPSEIDFLNGTIVREGARLGIATPTNLALQVLVKLREAAM